MQRPHPHPPAAAGPPAPGERHRQSAAPRTGLALGVLLLLLPLAAAAQLYRWIDDQGHVQYTDSIPPEFSEKGHVVLSPDGIPVQTVAPAKTLEEIQRERELERLRAQQHRLIEQQKAADQVLLRTFRSIDDLIMVRDGKLAAIDVMIQVTKSNIRRQQDWLTGLRTEAADLERAGKPVPERLTDGIASTERSITEALAAILDREHQKQEVRDTFGRDLKRFRQLREIPEEPVEVEETSTGTLENLVSCNDRAHCDRLWQAARNYVQEHATVPVESSGADVMMTAAPVGNEDIGLTLSRIWDKEGEGAQIFLDLQCRNYGATLDTCATPARQAVLDGFRSAIEAARGT